MNSLKQVCYFFFLIVALGSCTQKTPVKIEKATAQQKTPSQPVNDTIRLHELKKLFVTGDFDGDGTKDTLFQHNFSRLTGTEIEFSADPFQNEWDTVVYWFFRQESDVYLALNKTKRDTLHLGPAQGLYCLINVGDNNADGKDEIAFVIDHLDFSNVNSCRIYSLCKGKWTELQQFGIHEGSFSYTSDEPPVFREIEEFLEKQNGRWLYKDYSKNDYESAEEVGKMLPLKPGRCR